MGHPSKPQSLFRSDAIPATPSGRDFVLGFETHSADYPRRLFDWKGLQPVVWDLHPSAHGPRRPARARQAPGRGCSCSRWSALWGFLAVVLIGTLAHWFQWLLPVSALLCLHDCRSHRSAVRILAGGPRFALRGCGAELRSPRASPNSIPPPMPPTPLRFWPSCSPPCWSAGSPRASPNTPRSPIHGAARCTISMSSRAAPCR